MAGVVKFETMCSSTTRKEILDVFGIDRDDKVQIAVIREMTDGPVKEHHLDNVESVPVPDDLKNIGYWKKGTFQDRLAMMWTSKQHPDSCNNIVTLAADLY